MTGDIFIIGRDWSCGPNSEDRCFAHLECLQRPASDIVDQVLFHSEIMEGNPEIMDRNSHIMDGNSQIMDVNSQIRDGNSQIMDGNSQIMGGNSQIMDGNSAGPSCCISVGIMLDDTELRRHDDLLKLHFGGRQ